MRRQVELVPGGSSKAVTAENVVEYIHRVADYRLNYQIKAGSEAFWRGFFELVAHDWVTMFNEEEIQMLISGGGEGVDIADMQAHVNYAGGYHPEHPVILDFWKVRSCYARLWKSCSRYAEFMECMWLFYWKSGRHVVAYCVYERCVAVRRHSNCSHMCPACRCPV